MLPQSTPPGHRNSSRVNLLIAFVFHAAVILALVFLAARQGLLGKQLRKIAVEMVKEKPTEKPKEPEKPREEPPKAETPKLFEAPKLAAAAEQSPPPPSGAAAAVAPPPVARAANGWSVVLACGHPAAR